jgi:hypothetical protein
MNVNGPWAKMSIILLDGKFHMYPFYISREYSCAWSYPYCKQLVEDRISSDYDLETRIGTKNLLSKEIYRLVIAVSK